MSILLVDTDVVSFLFKQDSRAGRYAEILQGNQLAFSFMTVAELFQWAAVRNWGKRLFEKPFTVDWATGITQTSNGNIGDPACVLKAYSRIEYWPPPFSNSL